MSKPKTLLEVRLGIIQTRAGNKRARYHKKKSIAEAVERKEELEADRDEGRLQRIPYWRDTEIVIQTREVTPWRTYHHVKSEE